MVPQIHEWQKIDRVVNLSPSLVVYLLEKMHKFYPAIQNCTEDSHIEGSLPRLPPSTTTFIALFHMKSNEPHYPWGISIS